MSPSLRYCAYCQEPLAGRADKVYCTSSCKSKDFRRQQAEAAQDEAFRPPTGPAGLGTYAPVALRAVNGRSEDSDEDEQDEDLQDAFEDDDEAAPARFGPPTVPDRSGRAPSPALSPAQQLQQAVQGGFENHAIEQLPRQYAACVEQVLAADECLLTGRDLERLSEQVGRTLAAYQRVAEGANQPAFLAPHLADLYRLEELIDEAGAEWDEEQEPVALGLKKKLRARLRAAIALVARP
jgi:hypothetical protein